MILQKMIEESESVGYSSQDARAKVCQDVVLKAIASSSLARNVTIKGGVVMRSITGNTRRATQDMDIDFVKYSLADEMIDIFISKINCLPGIEIRRIGSITELNQQDYHGKSTHILIVDSEGTEIESKIDFGVHKHFEIAQEEYCFDIAQYEDGASLLINSKEQMFTEKLRSLLKFGRFSTRYKDIYDMYYLSGQLNANPLKICLESYIFSDPDMRENNLEDIIKRVEKTFETREYKEKVDKSDKRWIDGNVDKIFSEILSYLNSLKSEI